MYTNIKSDSYVKNTKLIDKIKSKRFDSDNVAFMTYQELFPEHGKGYQDENLSVKRLCMKKKQKL